MKQESFMIGKMPAILLGEKSDCVYLFVHGQDGNKEEAIRFANIVVPKGWQVLSVDLPEHGYRTDHVKLVPWEVVPELMRVAEYMQKNWAKISVRANSIGAWFSMCAFKNIALQKCLFVSPILDMEKLIRNMMKWTNVTEEQLEQLKEIHNNFGQTLSWKYLLFALDNPIKEWQVPTCILYAPSDELTDRETVDDFVVRFSCDLTVSQQGEHWFHTEEQVKIMSEWEEKNF